MAYEVPGLRVESELQLRLTPQQQQHQKQATSAAYTAACGNAGSLTHGARPGIEPASSWTLCQVLNPLSHNENPRVKLLRWGVSPGWSQKGRSKIWGWRRNWWAMLASGWRGPRGRGCRQPQGAEGHPWMTAIRDTGTSVLHGAESANNQEWAWRQELLQNLKVRA